MNEPNGLHITRYGKHFEMNRARPYSHCVSSKVELTMRMSTQTAPTVLNVGGTLNHATR